MNAQANLLDKLCAGMTPGKLEWIGLRSIRRGDVHVVEEATALLDLGLEGDHRVNKSAGSGRQVTLISREYITQIAHQLHKRHIDPALLRRNLVISGMNMNLLRYQHIQIGEVILELGALCHPCSRMDEALGQGGQAAMYGYGGLCAKVISGGRLALGDEVIRLPRSL